MNAEPVDQNSMMSEKINEWSLSGKFKTNRYKNSLRQAYVKNKMAAPGAKLATLQSSLQGSIDQVYAGPLRDTEEGHEMIEQLLMTAHEAAKQYLDPKQVRAFEGYIATARGKQGTNETRLANEIVTSNAPAIASAYETSLKMVQDGHVFTSADEHVDWVLNNADLTPYDPDGRIGRKVTDKLRAQVFADYHNIADAQKTRAVSRSTSQANLPVVELGTFGPDTDISPETWDDYRAGRSGMVQAGASPDELMMQDRKFFRAMIAASAKSMDVDFPNDEARREAAREQLEGLMDEFQYNTGEPGHEEFKAEMIAELDNTEFMATAVYLQDKSMRGLWRVATTSGNPEERRRAAQLWPQLAASEGLPFIQFNIAEDLVRAQARDQIGDVSNHVINEWENLAAVAIMQGAMNGTDPANEYLRVWSERGDQRLSEEEMAQGLALFKKSSTYAAWRNVAGELTPDGKALIEANLQRAGMRYDGDTGKIDPKAVAGTEHERTVVDYKNGKNTIALANRASGIIANPADEDNPELMDEQARKLFSTLYSDPAWLETLTSANTEESARQNMISNAFETVFRIPLANEERDILLTAMLRGEDEPHKIAELSKIASRSAAKRAKSRATNRIEGRVPEQLEYFQKAVGIYAVDEILANKGSREQLTQGDVDTYLNKKGLVAKETKPGKYIIEPNPEYDWRASAAVVDRGPDMNAPLTPESVKIDPGLVRVSGDMAAEYYQSREVPDFIVAKTFDMLSDPKSRHLLFAKNRYPEEIRDLGVDGMKMYDTLRNLITPDKANISSRRIMAIAALLDQADKPIFDYSETQLRNLEVGLVRESDGSVGIRSGTLDGQTIEPYMTVPMGWDQPWSMPATISPYTERETNKEIAEQLYNKRLIGFR